MKWIILATAILLLLPFYVFILSKSAAMGRIEAMKTFFNKNGGNDNGEKREEKRLPGQDNG